MTIVSVFQKGKKVNPRNFRPVSLTLVTGKIMENMIILGGIEKHMKDKCCHWSQPARPRKGNVLLVEPNFLL